MTSDGGAGRPWALVGGRILDGTAAPPIDDGCLLVEGGSVAAVGRRGDVGLPDRAELIEAGGRTVLPGLIDLHVHSQSPADLLLYVKNGVTSIRYAGGFQREILRLRARVERGELPGPRIFSCGPILDMPPVAHPAHTEAVTDPDQARTAVARLIADEAVDALIVTQRIDRPTMRAIIAEAHAHGRPVVGQNWLVSAREAVELGLDGLENTARLPESPGVAAAAVFDYPSIPARLATLARLWASAAEPQLDALRRAMLARDVTLCPAFVSFESWARLVEAEVLSDADVQRYVEADELAARAAFLERLAGSWSEQERFELIPAGLARFKQFAGAYRALGGRVVAGTDLPLGGVMLHRELRHLAEAGLSPAEVLAAATREAGRALRAAPLGTLVPGAPADLLVVDGDPLAEPACLRHPREVAVGGRRVVREGAVVQAARPS